MALGPGIPDPAAATPLRQHRANVNCNVRARSILGGLHHEYSLASMSAVLG